MAKVANVQDVEALKRLRAQIAKFAEQVGTAVADASADVRGTLHWLEMEQTTKWKTEQRKRHDKLQQALEQLRMKQLYKGPSGERQSSVDEEKRVKVCRAALEEAEWKLKAIATHKNRLSRDAVLFQGVLQRIGSISQQSAPAALAELGNMIVSLEKYAAVGVEEVGSSVGGGLVEATGETMGRGEGAAVASSGEGEGVDWEKFVARGKRQLGRTGGEVVVEGACDLAGKVGAWRDGFSGRVFVGVVGEEVEEGGELRVMTRGELLAAVPGVGETLGIGADGAVVAGVVGDGRGVFEGGERVGGASASE